jgi:hypothetical protein
MQSERCFYLIDLIVACVDSELYYYLNELVLRPLRVHGAERVVAQQGGSAGPAVVSSVGHPLR